MDTLQGARRRQLAAAGATALLLAIAGSHAIAQSETQPPTVQAPPVQAMAAPPTAGQFPASSEGATPGGVKSEAARQTALAIAGPASMTAASPPPTGQPATTDPLRQAAGRREPSSDERRQFMMLLILHATSRNPIGNLY
jgi:hypothetical protein